MQDRRSLRRTGDDYAGLEITMQSRSADQYAEQDWRSGSEIIMQSRTGDHYAEVEFTIQDRGSLRRTGDHYAGLEVARSLRRAGPEFTMPDGSSFGKQYAEQDWRSLRRTGVHDAGSKTITQDRR